MLMQLEYFCSALNNRAGKLDNRTCMRTFEGTTAVSYVSTHLWSSSNMISKCLRLVLPNCSEQRHSSIW